MTIETKKVASVNEAIAIISRLNYRNDTFQYSSTTREDGADVKYRHFDAYRDNGEQDGFSIIEIVVNGKLEVVRFFNLFRDITVDLKLGDFTPDYSRFDSVIEVATEETVETVAVNFSVDAEQVKEIGKEAREEIMSTPLTTAEALDVAVEAETELANAAVETAITISVPASKCDDLGEEALEEIKNELDEITEGKNFCCDVEQGICATVKTSSLQVESIEKLFDSYGLSYQRYVFAANKTEAETKLASVATTEVTEVDDDNVFDLLPTLDELNDVEEDPRFIIMDDAEYTERDARFNHGERHAANLQKELCKIDPTVEVTYDIDDEDDKDVFFFQCDDMFLRSNHATLSGVKDGFFFHKGNHNDETASMTTAAVETLAVAETTEAKAVNFATELAELQAKVNDTQAALLKAQDNHEKATDALNKFLDDTVIELAKKFHPLNPSGKIKIVTQSKGYSFTPVDFSEIYIDPLNCGKQFGFVDWRSRAYARYDTPIQIEKVIGMLKAAIERGDAEFIFPTVDALNQANFTADSLKEVTV